MKKLLLLMILVPFVAACGMGTTSLNKPVIGGGGSTGGGGETIPWEFSGTPALDENKSVTNMNTTTIMGYTKTNLANVHLSFFPKSGSNYFSPYFSFTLDKDYKITSLKNHRFGEYTEFERIGTTGDFYSSDTSVKYRFETFGGDFGLIYSELGKVQTLNDADEKISEDQYLLGGYLSKQVNIEDMDDAVFSGTAKGSVKSSESGTVLNLEDTNATLTFDRNTSTETLNANFANWYNVTVNKVTTDNFPGDPIITLSTDLDDTGKTINSAFQITEDGDKNFNTFYSKKDNPANNVAEEAAAIYLHQFDDGSKQVNTEIFFGGQVQ